jgi:SAM-dependent methyltransferase
MIVDRTEATPALTYWERVALTQWGRYVTEIERSILLSAHNDAGTLFRPPYTCLDVGCEGGRWSHMLGHLGWNLICTDTNPESLAICAQRNPAARCVLTRREQRTLPCASGSVQLIMCIEVQPVVQSGWFVSEAYRVLEDGGFLVTVFLNRNSLRGLFAHFAAQMRRGFDYYRHTYSSFRAALSSEGLVISTEVGCCWFPFCRDSNSRLVPYCTWLEEALGLRRLVSVSPWVVSVCRKSRSVSRQARAAGVS